VIEEPRSHLLALTMRWAVLFDCGRDLPWRFASSSVLFAAFVLLLTILSGIALLNSLDGCYSLGSMPTEHILSLLISERDKLNRAIEALGEPVKRRGRPAKTASTSTFDYNAPNVPDWVKPASAKAAAKKKRTLSAAGRKAIVAGAKKRWALIKAGKTAKAATVAPAKRKPMSAAQKKALSVKMKAAWAKRKKQV